MSDSSVLHLSEIAATPRRLPERAKALLVELRRHITFDASWIALAEPLGTGYTMLASTSLEPSVVEYLSGPNMARDIEMTGTDRSSPPASPSDLPYPAEELPTWAECLIPAGYHEALAVALIASDQRQVGFVALLSECTQPPTKAARNSLAMLAPILARGVDPMRSMLTAARLVQGASAGVAMCKDGCPAPLPGLADDALLVSGSGVLEVARAVIEDGRLYTSFLWPRGDRHALDGHVRVTVLTGADDVSSLLPGMVLLSPAGDLHGLTPRELEVLGLVIEGYANQEIARSLVVAPRTVATHLEHILAKLGVLSRTLAAVRAERQGLYVPPERAS